MLDLLQRIHEARPWVDQALCAQTDPDAFYPDKGGSNARAKAVCAACPVKAECLQYALENTERWGIWGGLTEPERYQLETRTRAGRPVEKSCGTAAGYRRHLRAGERSCQACLEAERVRTREAKLRRTRSAA